jgi:RNA polymerase sigma-70 factor (ECF subfamily)
MDLPEEKALVDAARHDPEVFGALFEAYYRPIFNYTLKRVSNIEIAQDITSEVFYKAVKNLWKFTWKNISFSAWLYTIANHQIIDWYRTKKHVSLDRLQLESGFDPADSRRFDKEFIEAEQKKLELQIDYTTLRRYISELPIHYQEVIVLRFFEKKKLSEIREIVHKKEGTVKSLLSRGLKKLRKIVEKHHPPQPL